jgi:hypothetical protein
MKQLQNNKHETACWLSNTEPVYITSIVHNHLVYKEAMYVEQGQKHCSDQKKWHKPNNERKLKE